MEAQSRARSGVAYEAIDGEFYRCPVALGSRSRMNIVFRLPSEELEKRFLAESKAAGMSGLAGHRSVGGLRASLYNAAPMDWATSLASFMLEFKRTNG